MKKRIKFENRTYHTMPNGDLLVAPRIAIAAEPPGYYRDEQDRNRFHPTDPSKVRKCGRCERAAEKRKLRQDHGE